MDTGIEVGRQRVRWRDDIDNYNWGTMHWQGTWHLYAVRTKQQVMMTQGSLQGMILKANSLLSI